jgi:hypothetical protein
MQLLKRASSSSPLAASSPEEPAPLVVPGFQIARSGSDPKRRWVDGTPEYSFYIHPLRLFFPQARFIHVVRDVSSVVRSMLNFERTGGPPLVQSEQEAYTYWLRTVGACYAAEKAFGSEVVYRLRHSDLVENPETSLRLILEFLEEPFEAACLEPLQQRINSSQVPVAFDPTDPKTDASLVAEAEKLSTELTLPVGSLSADPEAAAEIRDLFLERVNDLAFMKLQSKLHVKRIAELEAALAAAQRSQESPPASPS